MKSLHHEARLRLANGASARQRLRIAALASPTALARRPQGGLATALGFAKQSQRREDELVARFERADKAKRFARLCDAIFE